MEVGHWSQEGTWEGTERDAYLQTMVEEGKRVRAEISPREDVLATLLNNRASTASACCNSEEQMGW